MISMLDFCITETLSGDSWIRHITIFLDNAAINENNAILEYLYYKERNSSLINLSVTGQTYRAFLFSTTGYRIK